MSLLLVIYICSYLIFLDLLLDSFFNIFKLHRKNWYLFLRFKIFFFFTEHILRIMQKNNCLVDIYLETTFFKQNIKTNLCFIYDYLVLKLKFLCIFISSIMIKQVNKNKFISYWIFKDFTGLMPFFIVMTKNKHCCEIICYIKSPVERELLKLCLLNI